MQSDKDLKRLNDLITRLGGADHGTQSNGPSGLLVEHLHGARRSLLGSMRAEYTSSLGQAKESLACVPDKSARAEIKDTLEGLIRSQAAGHQANTDLR